VRSPDSNKCITIIWRCQEFLCYIIGEMKPAFIAAITLALVIYFAPRSKAEQRPSKEAGKVHNQTPPALTPSNKTEKPKNDNQSSQNNAPHWYESPEWILVIVGVITAGVICWQSWETRRAAKAAAASVEAINEQAGMMKRQTEATEKSAIAAERSIRLQEIIQQQWLEIDGWRREGFGSRESNPPSFTIAVDVSNPTKIPLTVKSARIGVLGESVAEYVVENTLGPDAEPIKITCSYTVKPEWLASYNAYSLIVVVVGSVVYTDCFERERTQDFRRACFLGQVNHFESSPIPNLHQAQEDSKNPI